MQTSKEEDVVVEHALSPEASLTVADLCAAIERGDLPYSIRNGEVVVRRDDVRALEHRRPARGHLRLADDTLHAQDEELRTSRSA